MQILFKWSCRSEGDVHRPEQRGLPHVILANDHREFVEFDVESRQDSKILESDFFDSQHIWAHGSRVAASRAREGLIVPASALVAGEPVLAAKLTASDWAALRRLASDRPIVMRCCGRAGIPVEGPTGTRFFRHRAGPRCVRDRSDDMTALGLRVVVATAAMEAGWRADPDCWSADVGYVVRAEHDGDWIDVAVPGARLPRQIVWRWSKAARSSGAGQAVILARSPVHLFPPSDRCSGFLVRSRSGRQPARGAISVDLGGGMSMDISSLTKAILGNDLTYRPRLCIGGTQQVHVRLVQIRCPACRFTARRAVLQGHWTSRCGRPLMTAALEDLELPTPAIETFKERLDAESRGPEIWTSRCGNCGVGLRGSGNLTRVGQEEGMDLGKIEIEESEVRAGLRHPFAAQHWCSSSSPCPEAG